MNQKLLLTGNEAVARGAWEAGAKFASAYPGTPSTEILENAVNYDGIYAEWAPNEKVALEAAIGASIAGVRSFSTMKHVGLNVAADPLFTFSYTGVGAGSVIVVADDPGMHSSQNEQDNRNYALGAKILMLEPSDSEESKLFTKLAFELSEKFDTPVLLRMTTRVCHSKSLVTTSEREEYAPKEYNKNIPKYVMTPVNAMVRRKFMEDRFEAERKYANESDINTLELTDSKITIDGEELKVGVVSAGVAYQYAREAFGENASYLKLGITYPLPLDLIASFAAKVDRLYVVEELDPYMETLIKAAGIDCVGRDLIPGVSELNSDIVRDAVFGDGEGQGLGSRVEPGMTQDGDNDNSVIAASEPQFINAQTVPLPVSRPPAMCAGCPHRGFFYALSKKKGIMITGDIGCYTLGSAPPLSAIDTCVCMGASISMGHGAAVSFRLDGRSEKVVSVIGDSTFFHSGVTGLMNQAYNGSSAVTVILDNRITAMTGQQENPGTGHTLAGEPAPEVDIPKLCEAVGIKPERIVTVNPLDLKSVDSALDEALRSDEPSVIITRYPCILKKYGEEDIAEFGGRIPPLVIDQNKCKKCGLCAKTGCPAIVSGEEVTILSGSCTGCAVCKQVCPFDAIA
jgi:indolepyruvate ferredoxin oxidoreductase alpha subunit